MVSPSPRVAALITTFNGKEHTLSCLQSLCRTTYASLDILVLDDASRDGTEETVRTLYPHVRVARQSTNVGYVRNLNFGIQRALDSDYILILNNDIVIAQDLIERLVEMAAADPAVGICGPRIHYFDQPDTVWAAGASISKWTARAHHRYQGKRMRDHQPIEVDYVPGTAALIPSRIFRKIGFFDPVFEAYYEEVDFCFRLRAAGYKCLYVPTTAIWHKVGATFTRPRQKFLTTRNRLWWARRHMNNRWLVIAFLNALIGAADLVQCLLLKGGHLAIAILRGYCAGWSIPPYSSQSST